MHSNSGSKKVSLRALLIVLIFLPINSYWIIQTELVHYSSHPTTLSLFFNVILFIFFLIGVNLLISKFLPRYAFSQQELLTIYILLSIGSSMSGHDMVQVLAPMLGHAFRFATPENEWRELFWQYLPKGLTIRNTKALEGLYSGGSTIYKSEHIRVWLNSILRWTVFYFALTWVMLCINVVVRKRWTENEKLTYPVIQLPVEMTQESGKTLFSNRLLWLGFAIAGGISFVNGLHFIFPSVPEIHVRHYNLVEFFPEKPWNAIGRTRLTLYPFAIGMGYFMPLELSFSCWFFYWVGKGEMILGSVMGWRSLPGFPYMSEQALGGTLGIVVVAIWAGRQYLAGVFRQAIGRNALREEDEPMKYRTALLGVIMGMALLFIFCLSAGMSAWVIVLFFGLYMALSLGLTRIRAELGPPIVSLWVWGEGSTDPGQKIVSFLGTRRLGPSDLTNLTLLFWFNRDQRCHPMPHQLEGFEIARRTRIKSSSLVFPMMLLAVLSSLTAFWAYLHVYYRLGIGGGFAWEPFNRLQSWLTLSQPSDYPALGFTGFSFLFTLFIMFMRRRFLWWPFHPVGYVLSGTWSVDNIWMPLFISWTAKMILTKYGGIRMYRRAVPFFAGLILGQFIVGGLWSLLGALLNLPIEFYFV
jgi:hypothetical protein